MSVLNVKSPYPIFTDTDGDPLESGYIWIGVANLDPQANPLAVFWDAALTMPAVQPIRTLAGYPSQAGAPGRLYTSADHSIRVLNKRGTIVFTAGSAIERFSADLIAYVGPDGLQYTVQDLADSSNVLKGDALIAVKQPFASAVARTQHQKNAEWVSVEDFGAVGDGVNDVSSQFNTAISALSNGDTLYIPSGVYLFNSSININKSISLAGENSTFIHNFDSSTLLNVYGSISANRQISDTITENDTSIVMASPAHGFVQGDYIKISTTENYFIFTGRNYKKGEIVRVKSVLSDTITLYERGTALGYSNAYTINAAKLNTISNVKISGITIHGKGSSYGQVGMRLQYCYGAIVENCNFDNMEVGLSISACVNTSVTKCFFKDIDTTGTGYGCEVSDSSVSSIVSGSFFDNCRHGFTTGGEDGVCLNTLIDGNTAINCDKNAALNAHGNAKFITFSNNTIRNSNIGISTYAPFTNITNNTISDINGSGIYADEAGAVDISVCGNNIKNTGLLYFSAISLLFDTAITGYGFSYNVIINGNKIDNVLNGGGISLTGKHINANISNNIISRSGYEAIIVNKIEHIIANSNLIFKGLRSGIYGIKITGATGADLSGLSPYGTSAVINSNSIDNYDYGINVINIGNLMTENNLLNTDPSYKIITSGLTRRSGRIVGLSTQSGTGATVYNIPHGYGTTPDWVTVSAASSNAAGDFYVTKTATNIVVTYLVAPTSGTNNLSWEWSVSKI